MINRCQTMSSKFFLIGLSLHILTALLLLPAEVQGQATKPSPAPVRIPLQSPADTPDMLPRTDSDGKAKSPVRAGQRKGASTSSPDVSSPTTQPKSKIPPSYVERVLREILVERDLASAREMLVEVLPSALNQVDNPQWIARIYILMAAVAALEGDPTQAHRLALRAVALDADCILEPQLGELPRAALIQARKDWQAREATIKVMFSRLPLGLELYVDGRATQHPHSIMLRPGDHLIQISGNAGVIARAWSTLKADTNPTSDPDPIPEVLRTVQPLDSPQPIDMAELSREIERMEQAQRDLNQVTSRAEVELESAKAALHMQRAACLAEAHARLRFLQEEVAGFKERLQWALDADKSDSARHLFAMMQVARDEALRQEIEVAACLDMPRLDGAPETRVMSGPSQPSPRLAPVGEVRRYPALVLSSLDAPDGRTLRMYDVSSLWDDPVWQAVPQTPVAPRPPPSAEVPPQAPQATPGVGATPVPTSQNAPDPGEADLQFLHVVGQLHAAVGLEAYIDSNPARSPSALSPIDAIRTGKAEVGVLATPRVELGTSNLAIRARTPLFLTSDTVSLRGVEVAAISSTRDDAPTNVAGGLEVRYEQLRPEQYSVELGELTRTSARLQVSSLSRPSSSLDIALLGQALAERIDAPGWNLVPFRAGFGLETGSRWWIFPQSALLLDAELAGLYRMDFSNLLDSTEDAWLQGFFRIHGGIEGRLGEGVWLTAAGGYQSMLATHGQRHYAIPADSTPSGRIELRLERSPVAARLSVLRQLEPESLLLARQFQGAQLSLRTDTTGLLSLALEGSIGSDILWGKDAIEGQYEQNGQPVYAMTQLPLPVARGLIELRFRLLSGRLPLWLTARYSLLARYGQWDRPDAPEWLWLHQAAAGIHGQF